LSDNISWVREYISLLSKETVKKWLILLVAAFGIFFVIGGGYGGPSLRATFSAAGIIGWLLATGFPFVMGASLIFCSEQTHNNIAEYTQTRENFKFSKLFVSYVILVLVSMALLSFAGLVVTTIASGYASILLVLPQLLGITLFISLLLAPIYLLIALVFDNARRSIIMGFILSIVLMIITGSPRFPVNYPEVAFFGPAHLLAALLFIAIGGYGNYSVEYYVGTIYQPTQLVVPILVWSVIAIVSYFGARRIFFENLPLWIEERDGWLSSEEPLVKPDTSTKPRVLPTIRRELHERQRNAVAIAIAIIILISIGGLGYVQVRQDEWFQVVYESPAGGETVAIGNWLNGTFTGIDPSPSITLGVSCEGRILDWTGGAGNVFLTFEKRAMSLSDFQALNDTEFLDMFDSGESGNLGVTGTFGSGRNGPIHDNEYVWALRFNEINGRTSGLVDVWFQLTISAFS